MNSYRETSLLLIRFIIATISVILLIIGAKSFASALNPRSGPVSVSIILPKTPIPTEYSSTQISIKPLFMKYEIVSFECGANGKVISASIDMEVSGGVAPYYLKFDPSDVVITNIQEETIVSFKLVSGTTVTVTAKSSTPNGEPSASQEIRAPSIDSVCDFPTPPPQPTIIQTQKPSLSNPTFVPVKECNDRIDNDKDGYIDFPNDPQCSSASDDSESHK